MSGRLRSEHVGEPREQQQPLVRRRVDERHERARFGRRDDGGPVDRRLERRADQPDFVAIQVGQELAARERVIDVGEVATVVVAESAHREGSRDAALPCARHRLENHRMAVAGDQLIGRELVEKPIEQRRDTAGLSRASGRDSSLWRVISSVTGTFFKV